MAKGIRALLDTVMQALPQVGNLGLLFFLLFFIFAALGVEMFGRLGELCKAFNEQWSLNQLPFKKMWYILGSFSPNPQGKHKPILPPPQKKTLADPHDLKLDTFYMKPS